MPESMKALVWEGPGVLSLLCVPLPNVKNNEVLIKVSYAGICATDREIFLGKFKTAPPYILGHEIVGTVVEVDTSQSALRLGDRVVVDPAIPCGGCRPCQSGKPEICLNYRELGINMDGGWAEYVAVPLRCVHRIPDSMDDLSAAIFEPMTCPFGAVETAKVEACDKVLIFGDGPAALYFTQIVRMLGAAVITVVYKQKDRKKLLKILGANALFESNEIELLKHTESFKHQGGFDLVIDAVGHSSTVQASIAYARTGGRIILYGFKDAETNDFPHREIILKNLTIYGRTNAPSIWPKAIECVSRGYIELEALVEQIIEPEQVSEFLKSEHSSVIKTVMKWN